MQETRRKPENRIRPAVDVAVEAGEHWRAMASDAKEVSILSFVRPCRILTF
jgi:hypothetical protein